MKAVITLLALLVFAATALVAEKVADLDDPKTLKSILSKALLWDTLEKRRPHGGRALYFAPKRQSPFTGWIKKLHPNGKAALLGALKDGNPSGLWTWWDEDGVKEDEKRQAEGIYKDGKKEGLWRFWRDNGQKKEELTFKNGEKEGPFTFWHTNGTKSEEGTFKDGKKHGLFTTWAKDGKLLDRATWKNGVKIKGAPSLKPLNPSLTGLASPLGGPSPSKGPTTPLKGLLEARNTST